MTPTDYETALRAEIAAIRRIVAALETDRLAERSHYDDCAGGWVIRVEDVPAVVAQWLRDLADDQWKRAASTPLREWQERAVIRAMYLTERAIELAGTNKDEES